MKKTLTLAITLILLVTLSGCDVAGEILSAVMSQLEETAAPTIEPAAPTTTSPPTSTPAPQPAPTPDPTPTPTPDITPVYKAYYDILMAAIDEYGIGADVDPNQDNAAMIDEWHTKSASGVYPGQGVYFAELIYFGDSEIPQLLYIYDSGYGPGRYVANPNVYGYSGTVEHYTDGNEYSLFIGGDDPYGELYLVTDRNGLLYLLSKISSYDDIFAESPTIYNTYYTVKNSQWVIISEDEIDIANSRDLNKYSPDSAYAVLDELLSLLPNN